MATFKSTTFGKISGKYGDALATQSKATGKNYLRVASTPSNPRTEKQVAHRAKFGFINSVLTPFYPIFKVNFGGNMGIRHGVSLAYNNAITGTFPDFAIDLTKLVFAEGSIYPTEITSLQKDAATKVTINWDNTILAGSNAGDLINLVFYNENSNQALLVNTAIQRSEATASIELPAIWTGATIHCWLYFSAATGTTQSNSQYVNSISLS